MLNSDLLDMLDRFDRLTGIATMPNGLLSLTESPALKLIQQQSKTLSETMVPLTRVSGNLYDINKFPSMIAAQKMSKQFEYCLEPFLTDLNAMRDTLAPTHSLTQSLITPSIINVLQGVNDTFKRIESCFPAYHVTSLDTFQTNSTWNQLVDQFVDDVGPSPSSTLEDITTATDFIKATINELLLPAYGEVTEQKRLCALARSTTQLTKILLTLSQRVEKGVEILARPILITILWKLFWALFLTSAHAPQAIPSTFHKQNFKEYRTVIGRIFDANSVRIVNVQTTLNVRYRPNKKSRIIGKLPPLAIVAITEKNKKWCFIRYIDNHTNCELSGWVYKKYLCTAR